VIYSEKGEQCGFFSFSLSLTRSIDYNYFSVTLPLVYVRPGYRKNVYALDLTFSLSYFLRGIFESVFRRYRGKNELNIVVNADFESKGGERIVSFILEELEVEIDMLKERLPHKAHKLGEIDREVGW
jgi:hypothetical protein